MDTKMMLALEQAGVDTQGALRRFCGNDALYERFLLKFPADENFGKIGPALEGGDLDAALTAAHTLKGVSGNLGMERLYQACADTVAFIRAGKAAEAALSYGELAAAYAQVCGALSEAEGAQE